MKTRIIGLLLFLGLGAFVISAFQPQYDSKEKERLIMLAVKEFLENMHFKDVELNDEFSKKAFDVYMNRLDGGKRFITLGEFDLMDDYDDDLDDAFENGDIEFFELSYEIIQKAVLKTEKYYKEILKQPFNFSIEELIQMDGEKLGYAKDDEELEERWRQYLKYETLTRLVDKLEDQETADDPEGGKKSMSELEAECREDVTEAFDSWFKRLKKLRRSDRFEIFLNSITNVWDPHSDYFNPKEKEDFDINMSGRLEGIGARLSPDGEYTKVVMIVPGGPSWKQKELQVDDLIVKVKQENEDDALDVVGMHLDDVVQKIRGKKGTKVTLTVKKVDGSTKDITIVRDEVILDEGFARSVILNFDDKLDNVGYIKLPRFYADFDNPDGRSCSEDVAVELEKLKEQNVKGIILDLRNNSGGSLNDVVKMSGLFIDNGPIVQVKGRQRPPYVYRDKDKEVKYDGPLIVMVNSYSASASEILAAALQDYGRAVVIGSSSTYGKGTVQRFFDLDRAITGFNELKPLGNVKMTIQKFYRVNGGSTQLKGVVPDIVLPDNMMYIESGEKRLDHPLEWTEIEPVQYGSPDTEISGFSVVRDNSINRVESNEVFALINENAKRIKSVRDQSEFPLNLDKYRLLMEERDAEAEKYKNIAKKEIEGMNPVNLKIDMPNIQMDSSRIARNDSWLEGIKKDIYLDETLNIMKDLIFQKERRS